MAWSKKLVYCAYRMSWIAREVTMRRIGVALAVAGVMAGSNVVHADGSGNSGVVLVQVSGIDRVSGQLVALLFAQDDGFPAKEAKAARRTFSQVTNSSPTLRFEGLPYGSYAVVVYHDENGNGKLDTKIFGIPKEPVGVSNNAKARLGPPKFKEARFDLREPNHTLDIKLVRP